MNLYMVQEYLGVLLVLAVSTATILVFAVAFVLFREGIRRAVSGAKTGVMDQPGLKTVGRKNRWPIRLAGHSS